MDDHLQRLIQALHNTPAMAAFVLTGGGAGAVAHLLNVPGASRTVLEAVIPYDESALCEYLGRRPEQFCSIEAAIDLAEHALDRARDLASRRPVIGLGCTAGLVTDRPKRGEHRFFVASATEQATRVTWATLQKDARDREAEESIVDAAIFNELAHAAGIAERVPVDLLPDEQLHSDVRHRDSFLSGLDLGAEQAVCVDADGRIHKAAAKPALLLPGAFNPLHEGHRRLAQVSARMTGLPPAYELSILNVDKPPLAIDEVRRRMKQFQWLAPLWLTRSPTFVEKARLFPGVTFVVGVDTAERIVDSRYYGNDVAQMSSRLERIRSAECRFLVAGRTDAAGKFKERADLAVPAGFQDLFTAIPSSSFRCDARSTQLRAEPPTLSEPEA